MLYFVDGIYGTEAVVEQKHLAYLLSNKLRSEYLEMCSFVRASMSLAIVRSKKFFFCGARDKESFIPHRPNLEDGSVIELMAPCRG